MKELVTDCGVIVPKIGLGTYPLQGKRISDVVKSAISIGYRLIDTADDYRNEVGIGIGVSEAISSGIIKREELFLQTKISNNCAYNDEPLAGVFFNENSAFMKRHTVSEVVNEKVENSLRSLKTDYLDSVLIHYPFPGFYEEIWQALIELKNKGIIRYIGVSNFYKRHLEILKQTGVSAQINQVYISPIGTKADDVHYCNEEGVQLMTYSPLIDIRTRRLSQNVEPFVSLINKYNKSISQIILRWNIEQGSIPIAKSQNPDRLRENFQVLDFSLTKDEIDIISSLNRDFQYLPTSRICPGF